MTIKAVVNVEVDASPEQLAGAFANMDAEEQARFLNECGRLFDEFDNARWGKSSGEMQVAYMTDEKLLTPSGRNFCEDIAGLSRLSSVKMPWPEVRDAFVRRVFEDVMEARDA